MFVAGSGGKGTWGALLDHNQKIYVDRNDPNYDSEEVCITLIRKLHSNWVKSCVF